MNLNSLKPPSIEQARAMSLPILHEGEFIGQLVPIGDWILCDREAISAIAEWRQRAMQNYLVQFPSTAERTEAYLRQLALGDERRLLFMIEGESPAFLGHLGLEGVENGRGELDNLMRGRRGGHPALMREAERTILSWAFRTLGLETIVGRVLSHNFIAIGIHREMGFEIVSRSALRTRVLADSVVLEGVPREESNVDSELLEIELSRHTWQDMDR